jgi:hypothetical protein
MRKKRSLPAQGSKPEAMTPCWYKQNKFIILDSVPYKYNLFARRYYRANVSVAQTMW